MHNILYLMILFIGCYTPSQEVNQKEVKQEIFDNELFNPSIILSRGVNKLVKAESKKMYKNINQFALLVDSVKIDIYDEEGQHMSILYCDSAIINEKNNNLKANGNVIVISDSGYTLNTQKIIWDNSYKLILVEDSVMFTTLEGDTLYGIGFESDADLEEWRIFQPYGIVREGI